MKEIKLQDLLDPTLITEDWLDRHFYKNSSISTWYDEDYDITIEHNSGDTWLVKIVRDYINSEDYVKTLGQLRMLFMIDRGEDYVSNKLISKFYELPEDEVRKMFYDAFDKLNPDNSSYCIGYDRREGSDWTEDELSFHFNSEHYGFNLGTYDITEYSEKLDTMDPYLILTEIDKDIKPKLRVLYNDLNKVLNYGN